MENEGHIFFFFFFLSKLDAQHFCSTAAGERASKGQRAKSLFEKERHWSPSLDGCHAALPVCVCVLRNLLCKIKERERGREKGGKQKGVRGGPYVT